VSAHSSSAVPRTPSVASRAAAQVYEVVEASSECLFLLDEEFRLTYCNKRAQAEIAAGRDLLGKSLWECFPEARNTRFEEEYRRAMEERLEREFEAYFPPLESWFRVKVAPLSQGGLSVWFRNVNAERSATERVRAAEERYRLASKATNELIWDWDIRTNEVSWNEAICNGLGFADGRLGSDGSWWKSRLHDHDRERVLREVRGAIATGADRFTVEYRFRRADGTYADILDRGFVLRSPTGEPLRMVGAMQDLTALNRTTAELKAREAQLATIFGQAMVGIMHRTMDGKILMVNKRLCEILDRTEAELRRINFEDYTHPDDAAWNKPLFERSAATGEPFQIEKRYLKPDGTVVWGATQVSFVKDGSGRLASHIIVVEDITARKLAEAELESSRSLLRTVIDGIADFIFVKNHTGEFILTNHAFDEACAPLTGRRDADFYPEDITAGYAAVDREVIESGETREVEEIIPVHCEPRFFHTVKVPWILNGEVAGVIGVSRDITERRKAEIELAHSEELYRSVLDASADCIKILSLDGKLELMNAPGLAAKELVWEDIAGQHLSSLWPQSDRPALLAALAKAAGGEVARFSGFCPTTSGKPRWWDVVVTPMRSETGEVTRLLSIARDITTVRTAAEQLRRASEEDALTGLPNRRSFQSHLQAATIRAMASGRSVSLLLIDLDHFKHVNDTRGHAAGDHLLRTFAERLRTSVRAKDFVARLGGDEFAVVLEGVSDADDVLRIGEAIVRSTAAPTHFDGQAISGSASIGGAIFPWDATNANDLFKHADTALYALKEAGRGGTKLFKPEMRLHAQNVASQLDRARSVVFERSVLPYYQPKYRLSDATLDGFEALLRWRHPSLGIQLPASVAEGFKDYEIASRIGTLMWSKVVADLERWRGEGVDVGRISINAAPAEFLRNDYAEKVLEILQRRRVPTSCVEIEVTEHVFLERSSEYVERALNMLSGEGVRIALDDFGTGSSSLSHLRDFPVDVVKIDRSFVERMLDEEDIRSIVNAVISLCRSLSIEVVAEGVETDEQRSFLRAMGCTWGQGYLFGKPVDRASIGQLMLPGREAA
jgi:diguanylate cyclase (GGDEF)-like protein/PAS domain S-box-containing protein